MTTPTDISSIAPRRSARRGTDRAVGGAVGAMSALTLLAAIAHALGVIAPTAPLSAGAVCLVTGTLAVVLTGPVGVSERSAPRSDAPAHTA